MADLGFEFTHSPLCQTRNFAPCSASVPSEQGQNPSEVLSWSPLSALTRFFRHQVPSSLYFLAISVSIVSHSCINTSVPTLETLLRSDPSALNAHLNNLFPSQLPPSFPARAEHLLLLAISSFCFFQRQALGYAPQHLTTSRQQNRNRHSATNPRERAVGVAVLVTEPGPNAPPARAGRTEPVPSLR